MEIKKTIKYEAETNVKALVKTNTLLNLTAVATLISVLVQQYLLALICIALVILLKLKLDYESGDVIAYYREKHGIPNATKIKDIKARSKTQI